MRFVWLSLILIACAQLFEIFEAPVIPEPIWQPAENTVYIFEGETEIYERLCTTRSEYDQTVYAATMNVRLHNRDYANEWRVVKGQCTLEET